MAQNQVLRGLSTISFYAAAHEDAAKWYTQFLGIEPYFKVPGYVEFRIGDYQHELGIIDSRFAPRPNADNSAGAIAYWHVDNLEQTLDKLISMGATVYEAVKDRNNGFVTASVVDPFGNILGIMTNPHFLQILNRTASSEATKCSNCDAVLNGSFCSACGQSAETHPINLHFLWHDIQHGLLHFDKGILYSAKELFARPGHSIREFIAGKRIKHFKPISLVLLLAGIYGLITHYFHINLLSNNIRIQGTGERADEAKRSIMEMSTWLSEHYALLSLLLIPVFAIGTYLAFKKSGYNFVEHLIINSFLSAQRLILHIVAFPLYYVFNETSSLGTIARWVDILGYALTAWALIQLFNGLSNSQKIGRTALSFLIAFGIQFMLLSGLSQYVLSIAK